MGSAEWFIHGNTFPEWKTTTGSLLWIHGKRTRKFRPYYLALIATGSTAGSGKSVLSYALPLHFSPRMTDVFNQLHDY